MFREKVARGYSGWLMLFTLVALLILTVGGLVMAASTEAELAAVAWAVGMTVVIVSLTGFIVVNPNESKVLLLFGNYKGTLKDAGFWWANPFLTKKRLTLRIRNFETPKLKVNDHVGNPIEIAAIVVWQVVETAEATFNVDDYENFVKVQSESAVRNLATSYPYDSHSDAKALRSHTNEIATELKREIHDRLEKAGVEVLEARISHLAYAPEIAGAMLRRQQASAIVAARQQYVEGAVGMVEHALELLAKKGVVKLDEERKASMVSNMLVVLCSDQHTQPVINTGTLYQ